jgi:hypothetical protein
MDAIPLVGKGFQRFFPCCLAVLCIFNYFEIWTRICKAFGLEDLAFAAIYEESRVENGRKLLRTERSTAKNRHDQYTGSYEMTRQAGKKATYSSDDENH